MRKCGADRGQIERERTSLFVELGRGVEIQLSNGVTGFGIAKCFEADRDERRDDNFCQYRAVWCW